MMWCMTTFLPDIRRNLIRYTDNNTAPLQVGDGDSELGGNWGGNARVIKLRWAVGNAEAYDMCLSKKEIIETSDGKACSRSEECTETKCPFNKGARVER
jgi:hypothetical protein